jgi:hypothetical protein
MPAHDEVDRIVDSWLRERPDLDFTPLQVLSRVARLSKHLDRARRTAFSRSELESWEFDVLSALRRAGSPYELSPKALLQQTLVFERHDDEPHRPARRARGWSPAVGANDGRGILVGMTPAAWPTSMRRSRGCWMRRRPARHASIGGAERLAGLLRKLSSTSIDSVRTLVELSQRCRACRDVSASRRCRACRDPVVELVETRWSSLSRPGGRACRDPGGRACRDRDFDKLNHPACAQSRSGRSRRSALRAR